MGRNEGKGGIEIWREGVEGERLWFFILFIFFIFLLDGGNLLFQCLLKEIQKYKHVYIYKSDERFLPRSKTPFKNHPSTHNIYTPLPRFPPQTIPSTTPSKKPLHHKTCTIRLPNSDSKIQLVSAARAPRAAKRIAR